MLSIHPSEVVSSYLFGIRRDLILYALIVLGTILPIIAALFRNLIQKNDQLNTVLVDLELSNDNLRQSQLELQHNLSQMEELTQEKEEAIEELEVKEKELIMAKDRAEEATKAKTNFLATMSHEIRTPMNEVYWVSTPLDHRSFFRALRGERKALAADDLSQFSQGQRVEQGEVKILLAEDNEVNQRLAMMLLERMSYACDAVENGMEAIKAVQSRPYDLILMDIQMPEMDGLEATRRIRKQFGRQHIIIALTANAMEGDREHYLREGMDDYLAKPIRFDALQGKLSFWLQEILNRKSRL